MDEIYEEITKYSKVYGVNRFREQEFQTERKKRIKALKKPKQDAELNDLLKLEKEHPRPTLVTKKPVSMRSN